MASVLTPYRPSDGNNPYTEAQLKALWKDLEPTSREPGKYSLEERVLLQREFLKYIAKGHTPTRACSMIQKRSLESPETWPYADYAVFMAWKVHDKDFSDAYEVAYAMGTDTLEDIGVDIATTGNASMLQFLLKMRNPKRYNPKTEVAGTGAGGAIEHVHRIELVAAKPQAPQIEHQEIEDAEVITDE